MMNDHNVLIKNIYYMFAYVFRVLNLTSFSKLDVEEFGTIHNLYAAILSIGISRQLKQGLYKEYKTTQENLAVLRGKLDIKGTVNNQFRRMQRLSCDIDELTENNIYNQILKSTSFFLVNHPMVDQKWKKSLKRSFLYFNGVEYINLLDVQWNRLIFQRQNQTYEVLLNICYFVVKGLIQRQDEGKYETVEIIEDNLAILFEKFVLAYYKYHHPQLNPASRYIEWDVNSHKEQTCIRFLPQMKTDIMLQNNGKVLIIDTKFYRQTMQKYYDTYKFHSHNLYQIYTYVKNKDKFKTGNVSGLLLYAKTNENITPNAEFVLDGHLFQVKSLNLYQSFSEIKKQLDYIVHYYFRNDCYSSQSLGDSY